MKNEMKIVTAFGVAAVLAGCASTPAPDPLTSYTEVDTEMSAMADTYLDETGELLGTVSATSWDDLPDNTSTVIATYNGFVGGVVDKFGDLGGRNLVGELELTADFGAESISATADNFYDSTDVQYTGTLTTLVNGDIGPVCGFMMCADLTGDLSNGVDPAYTTEIALDGWFIGGTYDAVGGYADISIDGGFAEGVFIAEQ